MLKPCFIRRMAQSLRSVIQKPFVVNLATGKMVQDIGSQSLDGFGFHYDRKDVEGDPAVTVLPQLKVIREPKKPTTPLTNSVGNSPSPSVSHVNQVPRDTQPNSIYSKNTEGTRSTSFTRGRRRNRRDSRAKGTISFVKKKKQVERSSPDYIEAMLHRPNYTYMEPQNSPAFRNMARERILNMANRGVCSSDFCKAYRGTREVEFDTSTDCRNVSVD